MPVAAAPALATGAAALVTGAAALVTGLAALVIGAAALVTGAAATEAKVSAFCIGRYQLMWQLYIVTGPVGKQKQYLAQQQL